MRLPHPLSRSRSDARRVSPWVWAASGLTGVVLLAWVILAIVTTQHIFAGSTISGIDVGSMTPKQARAAVSQGVGEQLAQPVTLTVTGKEDATAQLTPGDSGVSVDAAASVKKLTGWTANPVTLVRRVMGVTVHAVTRVDREDLTTALEALSSDLSQGTQDATVTLEGTTPTLTAAVKGTGMDVEASVAALASSWPLGQSTVSLVEGETEPAITDDKAQAFIDQVLTPLLSAPVTVTAAGTDAAASAAGDATLQPETLAAMTAISSDSGKLTATINPDQARQAIVDVMGSGIEKQAQDTTVSIEGTPGATPVYTAGQSGLAVDGAGLAQKILDVATSGSDSSRSVTLPLTVNEPAHNESEEQLGVKEIVGEYATPYYYDPVRTQNLAAGTAQINGTLIRSGETFSLEQALGDISPANGFAASGVIVDGKHTEAMGGGLSQVATTTFNAAFEAGMDDVEHHPHSVWFQRYPAGREATLWTGNLDVKWKNSTPYAALVQAWIGGGQVHVRLWSTTYYTVSITSGERTNYRPLRTKTIKSAQCEPYSGGEAGFDITVTRSRTAPDGTSPDNDVLNTSYQPDDIVRCVTEDKGEGEDTAPAGT